MFLKNNLLKITLVSAVFVCFNFLISFFSSSVIKTPGSFPYKAMLSQYKLPDFVTSFANFDGAHYIRIAEIGYHNFEQAFFPLYPILIWLLSFFIGKNYLINGIVLSVFFFSFGLLFFYKYLSLIIKSRKSVLWAIVFLMVFPTSFFFLSVYTESLFFFLVSVSLYFLEKKRYVSAAVFGIFSSLSRLTGVFLIVPFLAASIKHKNYKLLILSFFPIAGLSAYSLYLYFRFGDGLLFYHAQALFGANRSSTQIIFLPQIFYRYLRIFISGQISTAYFVSIIEFFIFNFVFWVLIFDFYKLVKNKLFSSSRLGLNLFSLSTILLPTLTGTFSSIPRYSLFSLSFFLIIGELKNTYLKISIGIIFVTLHIIMLALFSQGYFVG